MHLWFFHSSWKTFFHGKTGGHREKNFLKKLNRSLSYIFTKFGPDWSKKSVRQYQVAYMCKKWPSPLTKIIFTIYIQYMDRIYRKTRKLCITLSTPALCTQFLPSSKYVPLFCIVCNLLSKMFTPSKEIFQKV